MTVRRVHGIIKSVPPRGGHFDIPPPAGRRKSNETNVKVVPI